MLAMHHVLRIVLHRPGMDEGPCTVNRLLAETSSISHHVSSCPLDMLTHQICLSTRTVYKCMLHYL